MLPALTSDGSLSLVTLSSHLGACKHVVFTHKDIHINKNKPKKRPNTASKAIILTLSPWYQKTSYILSTHNGINASILTGRNKSIVGKEKTKARPRDNRENTKSFSSISGIWYS